MLEILILFLTAYFVYRVTRYFYEVSDSPSVETPEDEGEKLPTTPAEQLYKLAGGLEDFYQQSAFPADFLTQEDFNKGVELLKDPAFSLPDMSIISCALITLSFFVPVFYSGQLDLVSPENNNEAFIYSLVFFFYLINFFIINFFNTAIVATVEIRMGKDGNDAKSLAKDYERKAMALLKRAQSGDLEVSEADRLATEALSRKEEAAKRATEMLTNHKNQQAMADKLQAKVNKLKSAIGKYENELVTLKARARTAESMVFMNN